MTRAERARARLERVRAAAPEHRGQALGAWLELATGAEVRRAWRAAWGPMPGWAAR